MIASQMTIHYYNVPNVDKEGGDIVTDINSNSLSVLKKAFKEN